MGDDPVTGRLAPSPTGALHLGHAFSFLAAYLSARGQGGRVILRLEDVDSDRAAEEHVRSCIEDLRWLGLEWDGEPIVQSERSDHLKRAAQTLFERGLAYPCVCTRKELALLGSAEEVAGAPHEQGPKYPGTCRGKYGSLRAAEEATERQAGLRFRVSDEYICFQDAVFGEIGETLSESVGDFLILRRNKVPAYQLAVVADDHRDSVTEVVRGRDLLSSTARQIAIARALGIASPRYAHVPLICDADGRRLAKRDSARSLGQLRADGISPARIVQWARRALGQRQNATGQPAEAFLWEKVPREDILLPGDLRDAL